MAARVESPSAGRPAGGDVRVIGLAWTPASPVLILAIVGAVGVTLVLRPDVAWRYFPGLNWGRGVPVGYMDGLLIAIWLVMLLLASLGADLRRDSLLVAVGLLGGLAIEAWGTQTALWRYPTLERPPLWIIPAWPIAALAIDRLARLCDQLLPARPDPFGAPAEDGAAPMSGQLFAALYWLVLPVFYLVMLFFVSLTLASPLTVAVLAFCALAIVTPPEPRLALLTFLAGAALGYFLELWGTTRQCWTYYTGETPPVFAVLAHGMAALLFWRVFRVAGTIRGR